MNDELTASQMGLLRNEEKDGLRFRFWCWMIENHPSLMAVKIANCVYINEYRKAIDELMIDFQSSDRLQ